jgi:hypothetical protein
MFLKEIVSKYNEYCRQGKAEITDFILTIAFPDAPDYGQWRVTVKDLTLSRNANAPMLFRYQLSLICLTGNMQQINVEPLPEVIDTEDNTVVVRAPDIIKVAPEGASVTADVASAATGAAAASDTGTSSGAGKAAMANPAAIAAANQAAAQVHNPFSLFSYTVPEANPAWNFQYDSTTNTSKVGGSSGVNVSILNKKYYDSENSATHPTLNKATPFQISENNNSIILAVFFWQNLIDKTSILDITSVRTIGNVNGNPNQNFVFLNGNQTKDSDGNTLFWKSFYLSKPKANSSIIFDDSSNGVSVPSNWTIMASYVQFDNVWADANITGGVDFSYNNQDYYRYTDGYITRGTATDQATGSMLYEICGGNFLSDSYEMYGYDTRLDTKKSSGYNSKFAFLDAYKSIRANGLDTPFTVAFLPKTIRNFPWATSVYVIPSKRTVPPFNAGQATATSWYEAPRSINQVVKFFWGFSTTDSQEFRDARAMFVKLNPETGNLTSAWDDVMPIGTTVWIPTSLMNKNKNLSFNQTNKQKTIENPFAQATYGSDS